MSLSSPASPVNLHVVILAAGKGKRMVSDLPKVLHAVGGRPMLGHVIASAQRLGAARIVVVHGHGSEQVLARFGTVPGIAWAEQAEQLGTGHAVAQALPVLPADGLALVLYGDVPLVRPESLTPLLAAAAGGGIGLLTVELPDPTGYGRIVRDDGGRVLRIVEEKDADAATKRIREGNTGILAAPLARLRDWVGRLGNTNAQGEYYLTDIIEMAVGEGLAVVPHTVAAPEEVQGVNNRVQLAGLERFYQRAQAEALMTAGATLADPARIDVRGEVSTGRDVQIDVNVVFEGRVVLGDRVRIGANCVLRDCTIADDVEIRPFTLIEQAEVGTRAQLGPYARLRPGSVLAEDTRVGNFVELKNSTLAAGAKANHLSYIGDATVGAAANIGAGTIICNYDGVNKSRTVIGDGAFIGSNSSLIAPVTIGAQATVGAGSAIGKDVPDATLAITRAPQKTITSWKRPEKKT